MAAASASVTKAAQPSALTATWLRRSRPRGSGMSVAHHQPNTAAVTAAAMTGQIHQEVAASASVQRAGPAAAGGVSTDCARSTQPQTCAAANSGVSTSSSVTVTPNSSVSTPASSVLASGARYLVLSRRCSSSGVPGAYGGGWPAGAAAPPRPCATSAREAAM